MMLASVILGISVLITLVYNYLIVQFRIAWNQAPLDEPKIVQLKRRVSVIVAARNEEENLTACLESILNQNLPAEQFEVILVDDHSEDQTVAIASQIKKANLKIIQLKDHISSKEENQSYKKQAIALGIDHALGEIILTTDADCIVSPDWIRSMSDKLQSKEKDFVTGPVRFNPGSGLLHQFQTLDLMGMMGVTYGGIQKRWYHMANGANMCFEKSIFKELGAYDGNEQYASGDDMFLIQKFAHRNPFGIDFVKNENAIVDTAYEKTWTDLFWQRIRWASKNKAYKEKPILWVQAGVFLFHVSIIMNLLLGVFNPALWLMAILQLSIKGIIDFGYLKNLNRFFKSKRAFSMYPIQVLLHTLYIVSIGFLGNVKKNYRWKGRKLR